LAAIQDFPTEGDIFTQSRQPWVVLPADTPSVSEYYDLKEHWPKASIERLRALRAAS
jgi:hypothetical protein